MPLSDAALRALKPSDKAYKKADSGGLYILVQPAGSRLWRFKYRLHGKEKLLSGGAYPAVGLASARQWRDKLKSQLAAGVDPSDARRVEKRDQAFAAANTFRAVAQRWITAMEAHWGEKYRKRVERYFKDDVYPVLGKRAIADISGPDILDLVRRIERRGVVETAHRVRALCSKVFRYAMVEGLCKRDPTEGVVGAQKRKPKVVHRAKVAASDMPTFFTRLKQDEGAELSHLALRWTIHTMSRTNETRFAEHGEIDLEQALWRIPASKMKMGLEHLVPLSPQVLEIYHKVCLINSAKTSRHLFALPGTKSGVISENRMLDVMYRQGYRGKATVHGFRGLASTVLNEQTREDGSPMYHPDWIEIALSHVDSDTVRSAYNSAVHLGSRRTMMAWWSNWLDQQEAIGDLLG